MKDRFQAVPFTTYIKRIECGGTRIKGKENTLSRLPYSYPCRKPIPWLQVKEDAKAVLDSLHRIIRHTTHSFKKALFGDRSYILTLNEASFR